MAAADPGTARRKWRWWHWWLVLLVASQFVQLFWPRPPHLASDQKSVEVAEVDGDQIHANKMVRFAYRDQGQGDVVVLIHGSPGSGDNFHHLAPMLSQHFRVISVDLPGFGASTTLIPDYSHTAHARYVLELLDRLEIDRAHFLGYSMGSGVALQIAHLAPQRVESLLFYGGVGVAEGEGTGDPCFEKLKNVIGYGLLVVAPEFIPHFGLLGPRASRHAFVRNFLDSDFRPLRGILENWNGSLLILQGRHDPLVAAWVAELHHEIVEQSELVMFDDSHFMVFSDAKSRQLADEIIPFVEKCSEPGYIPTRRTLDYTEGEPEKKPMLPIDLNRDMSPWTTMGAIIIGTFILEDPTSIGVGLLIRDGLLDPFVGVLATFLGIFIGDIGLYMLGAVAGKRALRWRPIARRLPAHHLEALGRWFDRNGWSAVLASRFLPGTRFPLYVAAGIVGTKRSRFALWTFLAVLIWTPVIILIVIFFGEGARRPFQMLFGDGWLSVIAAIILLLVVLRTVAMLTNRIGRQRLIVMISRIWRWEFWPVKIFYLPLVPWVGWQALKHRSLMAPTAANPGIPHGGVVGESKYAILSALPASRIVPSAFLAARESDRVAALHRIMEERAWEFPLVLKPDVGERGQGLKLVRDSAQARSYFEKFAGDVLVQTYDPGPHEAGVFYYRLPGEAHGHIFSITDKQFPVLVGNGRSTFEELIWAHPRFRMQAWVFLHRHDEQIDRVLEEGEQMRLAVSGNHCQGTMFREGGHLMSPQLEAAVDEAAQAFDGYYFGRFDLRYTDVESFKAGRDFRIVELNGVLSESSNIYDPRHSILFAYRTLARQWALAFEIGARNAAAGAPVTSLTALIRVLRSHRVDRRVEALAD